MHPRISFSSFDIFIFIKYEMQLKEIKLSFVNVRCEQGQTRQGVRPLTHCPLKPYGTDIQISVEANVARGYVDTEHVLVSTHLQWMLFDQPCKS